MTYKPILVRMMSYLDDEEYERDTAFSQAQLGALTENLVMKWFNFEVYEVPEPLEGHDLNPLIRSNTIKYWKMALSFFMPNRLTAWNQLTGYGNPTRSQRLNDLIKKIKRKEVRGQGAPSRARRSITGIVPSHHGYLEGGRARHSVEVWYSSYDELPAAHDQPD